MFIFKTKKRIKLCDKSESENIFSLSNTGWAKASAMNDFNPLQFTTEMKYGSYDIPGNQKKGYKKIERKDIEQIIKPAMCLDNLASSDKKLLKLIWEYLDGRGFVEIVKLNRRTQH